ncbi:MAG TPA: hypothetical protein VFU46_05730 [Gemmatimonadales bacterium]|nr:hypothetical protein [Gemmatimonadales bacterium]
MRTTFGFSVLALLAMTAGGPLAAQQPEQQPPSLEEHGHEDPAAQPVSAHNRELARNLKRLRELIHETNRWMIVQGTPEGYHGVGTEMAHLGEHMQQMIVELDAVYRDPEATRDPAGLRNLERVRQSLQELERQLEQTHAALLTAIGRR